MLALLELPVGRIFCQMSEVKRPSRGPRRATCLRRRFFLLITAFKIFILATILFRTAAPEPPNITGVAPRPPFSPFGTLAGGPEIGERREMSTRRASNFAET